MSVKFIDTLNSGKDMFRLNLRKKRKAGIAVTTGASFLLIFIYIVGAQEVVGFLRLANPFWVGIAIIPTIGAILFRGFVWIRILTVIDRSTPKTSIFFIYLTSTLIKLIVPYGQISALPAMSYILGRYSDIHYDEAFAGVVSIDTASYPMPLVSYGAFALLYFSLGPGMSSELSGYPSALVLVTVLLVVVLAFILLARNITQKSVLHSVSILCLFIGWAKSLVDSFERMPVLVSKVFESILSTLNKDNVEESLSSFYKTIDFFLDKKSEAAIAILYSHIAWLLLAIPLYFLLLSVGVETTIPLTISVVAVIGILFMPLPSSFGTGEILLAGLISALIGVELTMATAVALIYRVITYWLPVIAGGMATVYLLGDKEIE